MKKLSLILLSLFALFFVSCKETDGHKNMSEFIDRYTDTNPIWWDTSRSDVNIKEAFAEKMTSDIYFAKSMAENLIGTPNSNHVYSSKVLGIYERHDDDGNVFEYGQIIQFEIHSKIKMKNPMPDGKNSIRVSYNIISLTPASEKRKFEHIPYIHRDTCGENKVSNFEIKTWTDSSCGCCQSYIIRLGTYIFSDKTDVLDFNNLKIGWRDGNSQDNTQTTKDFTNNLTVTAIEDISGKIFSMEEYEKSLKPFTKEGDWYVSIEEAPQYGDYFDSLFEYLKEQSSSIEPKVKTSGDIYIGLFVNKDGKVSNVNVIKDCGGYGENFKKIIESMPKWKPGLVDGKPVKCFVGLSITLNIK